MDRRFEGLIFSLVIHALLVWLLFLWPSPPPAPSSERVEVSFNDPPARSKPKTKSKTFIEETNVNPKPIEDLKDTADFLSQFTKRVKKQLIARQNGPTRNSKPNLIPNTKVDEEPIKHPGVAGMNNDRPPSPTTAHDRGEIGLPVPGGNQTLHQVAIGPSSIAEYIPGVDTGDFTALNTDQFTYYAFFARINEQVRNRWIAAVRAYMSRLTPAEQNELSKADRQTVIEVILNKSGDYETKVIEMSSGDPRLDQTTVDAFIGAAPFVNPPSGMVENDQRIHLKYGFMVRFRPPFAGGAY